MTTDTTRPASVSAGTGWPEVRTVTVGDIGQILGLGVADFRAAPKFGLFFGGVYAVGGWLIALLLVHFGMTYLVFPMATGFALIAPFVATGLYDVSRRLERGEDLTWAKVLGSVRSASGRDLAWMALITSFTLIIWMDAAAFLYFGFMGLSPDTNAGDLVREIFTTGPGLAFLVAGNVIGALIALVVFSYSVVSFPMLYDRAVDFVTAMVTSIKVVIKNPAAMLFWAAIIAVLLLISIASAFVALPVVLPVLGHASWHLYRRAVAPAAV